MILRRPALTDCCDAQACSRALASSVEAESFVSVCQHHRTIVLAFEMIRSHPTKVPELQAPPWRPCRHRCHTVAPPASVRPSRLPLTCMQLRTWLRRNYFAVAFAGRQRCA